MLNEDYDSQVAPNQIIAPKNFADIDPQELANFFSEELLYPHDDENYMLDTTRDLPIRKPQSAYVIFGKLVSNCQNQYVFFREEIT